MTLELPATDTLRLRREGCRLLVELHRPDKRNAMSLAMVDELDELCRLLAAAGPGAVRAVVLRGAGGTFCAGGDLDDLRAAPPEPSPAAAAPRPGRSTQPAPAPPQQDPIELGNRAFGQVLTRFDQLPQAVVAVVEGNALGGGLGLACIADLTITARDARFGMPETRLGLVPAQIAPFVMRRIGSAHTRRLAVTGTLIGGDEAARLGIAHESHDADALDDVLEQHLRAIERCGPHAVAATKELLRQVHLRPLDPVLDDAARLFARSLRGVEAQEGLHAFADKRRPAWSSSS
ncbi:MAG: enoyl-CoA hydratase-related protein [Acidobacteriota bacterium]